MSLSGYLKDTKAEMRHVSWPTRRQAIIYTVMVIVISLITAAILGFFDTILTYLLDTFIV